MRTLEAPGLDKLLALLRGHGFTPIGPTVRDGAVVLDELASATDLPVGMSERQEAGTYRLERKGSAARFAHGPGATSAKRFLLPPQLCLLEARRDGAAGIDFTTPDDSPPALALIGLRACDLAGLEVLDRVLAGGDSADPAYVLRRRRLFVVAVQCGHAAPTCFCASLGTGPAVTRGYDLLLTELDGGDGEPIYTVASASEAGAKVLAALPTRETRPEERLAAAASAGRAAEEQTRHLDTEGLPQLLAARAEHPRWSEVAGRCLSCGNCTLVCPTCFCTTVDDDAELGGAVAARQRRWDTCFATAFTYIHGGSVRPSVRARYRHWLTHKLGTWTEQFGTFGCVGCGRCITWCPVGIDLTEEVRALRRPTSSTAEPTP